MAALIDEQTKSGDLRVSGIGSEFAGPPDRSPLFFTTGFSVGY